MNLPVSVYSAVKWGCSVCLVGFQARSFERTGLVSADFGWCPGCVQGRKVSGQDFSAHLLCSSFIPGLPFLDSISQGAH